MRRSSTRGTVTMLAVLILAIAAYPARTQTVTGGLIVYLPLVTRNWPPLPSVFGVEIHRGKVVSTASHAGTARVSWVRYNGILWSEVEPTRGYRRWDVLADVEAELRALSEQQLVPMVIVRGTPAWAQSVPGSECGPIRPDALDAFALFVHDLVKRYSGPPYNITYWEIWNEPDAPVAQVSSVYGCWGDTRDAYHGGGAFGEMLKRVYQRVKEANPAAQVVLGGLLLDCDPTAPPPGKDCRPARFLEGVLRVGGGAAFDLLAFHGYPLWDGRQHDWDYNFGPWSHRGGVVLGKADFLRSVLRQFGHHKPLILNEGGLLCWNAHPSCQSDFLDAQANYVVRLYTRAWANQLAGAIWYTLDGPGWNLGGLLDAHQQPKPAYHTLHFLAHQLAEAEYVGHIERSPQVEGYAFRKGTTTYWLYWTNDGALSVLRSLPPNTRAVYSKEGNRLPFGSSLSIGFDPMLIEIGP